VKHVWDCCLYLFCNYAALFIPLLECVVYIRHSKLVSDGEQLTACDRCKGHFAYLYRKKVSCRGSRICVPRSRKRVICVPRCLLDVYQLRSELLTARLRKCISCVPRCLLHVCHTETRTNVLQKAGSESAAQRETPPTHTYPLTHT